MSLDTAQDKPLSPVRRPIQAFEHYMYADDRPSHPMVYAVRATLSGAPDRQRFEAAARAALTRHPMLCSRLEGEPALPGSAIHWVLGTPAALTIDWADDKAPLPVWGVAGLDLQRAIGLKLFVRQGAQATVVTLQVHHAATDAMGVVQYLEDLLAFYDGQSEAELKPLDADRLAHRGQFHLDASERRARLLKDLARIALFFRQFPEPVATGRPTVDKAQVPFPAAAQTALSASDVRSLRAGGRAQRATVNDMLLRDLFLTLDAWNIENGGSRPLRLAMPINMRRAGDELIPAANIVSMCFLDRKGVALQDPERLLKSIVAETRDIKVHYMGHALIVVVNALTRIKQGIVRLATPTKPWTCSASAVLSNLGEPLAKSKLKRNATGQVTAAGLTLQALELLPPVRPGTALAIGVVSYAGKTHLTAHVDPSVLATSDAVRILAAYETRLRASMREPTTETAELAKFIEKHTQQRVGASALRSLPIGKHVLADEPILPPRRADALMPPPSPAE